MPQACASGEAARRASSRRACSTPTATSGKQFAAGEPVVVELVVASEANVAPPLVSLELRDDDGVVLAGVTQPTAELGWSSSGGERTLRFEIERLPLADGRFHLRCALVEADGGRLLHSLDDAVRFFVFPPARRNRRRAAHRPLDDAGDSGASEPIGQR